MPTEREYEDLFNQVSIAIEVPSLTTRAQCIHQVFLEKKAIRLKRDELTREITNRWKEGFKRMKEENDRLQHERLITFEQEENACHEEDMRCEDQCNVEFPLGKTGSSSGRIMCLRQCSINHKICLDAARKNRVAKTREISIAWKEGFKGLKEENDEWQKSLNAAYRSAIRMADEGLMDLYELLER